MTAIYAISPGLEAGLLGVGFGALFVSLAAIGVLARSVSARRTDGV